jgi:hypothetical protein
MLCLRGSKFALEFNIYVGSERAGQRVMESVTRFISHHLKVKVNQAKSAIARPGQRKFLGFSFTGGKSQGGELPPKLSLALSKGSGSRPRGHAVSAYRQMVKQVARMAPLLWGLSNALSAATP